jgi:hypothetical protein
MTAKIIFFSNSFALSAKEIFLARHFKRLRVSVFSKIKSGFDKREKAFGLPRCLLAVTRLAWGVHRGFFLFTILNLNVMTPDKMIYTPEQLALFDHNFSTMETCCDTIEGLSTILGLFLAEKADLARANKRRNESVDFIELGPDERWGLHIMISLIREGAIAAKSLAVRDRKKVV